MRIGALLTLLAVCAALVLAGCGSDGDAVDTKDPKRTFAPLVMLHPDEQWRPMGVRWFLARSSFWFAEDYSCEDRKIAVGRTLKAQRNPIVDWIFPVGLGKGPAYARFGYDERCEVEVREDREYFASQRTRPNDTEERPSGLATGEGFYLDLMDRARRGPRDISATPAYVEARRQDVDDEAGLRLTYWFLYGMNEPRDDANRVLDDQAREGDWERIDVVLEGDDDRYTPISIRLIRDGKGTEVAWDRVARTAGGNGNATHPVLLAERGSHSLSPASTPSACESCPRWRTWRRLTDLRTQPWYGFGGAWGETGPTLAMTGPLGPHGKWKP